MVVKPALSSGRFRLLRAFEGLFYETVYKHRNASLGNHVAVHLYEDLEAYSPKFAARVAAGTHVVNASGTTRGVRVRRGDGTFGAVVAGAAGTKMPTFVVLRGMVALTHIGIEAKFVATAHLKQIDRVIQDLTGSAKTIKEKSANAITVGLAAVNYSDEWTGQEGTRQYPADRTPARAMHESEEASRRLLNLAAPSFDEFVLLKFKATNRPPVYPFAWLSPAATEADYGAGLVRIAELYERRFG